MCKSRAQVEAAAKIHEGCACYMWITEQVKFADENLMFNLSNYINLHERGLVCGAALRNISDQPQHAL